MKQRLLLFFLLLNAVIVLTTAPVNGQGVTTGSIKGRVVDETGEGLPGTTVIAVHTPSGTTYGQVTMLDGGFTIGNVRVGGPYKLTVSFVGYPDEIIENINVGLGATADIKVAMSPESQQLQEVVVEGDRNQIFSSERTGAGTAISNEVLTALPTINRRVTDFTRLTPQSNGFSFAGADSRLNNITVDGSYFNNSFGLGGQPGDRTGVSPISLDAIEAVQVNIAPYDVRQGNFVGAGINTVTRSGTNEFEGSAYYLFRNESFVGSEAQGQEVDAGEFAYNQIGARIGGPIIKNKLFFFASFERETEVAPGTNYTANEGGETVEGTKTRVQRSDLDELRTFLRDNFNYETGPYQGYDNETNADKFLIKFDYNLNAKNKFSLRYIHLNSFTDVLASNSSSRGFGPRRSNNNALNFQNTNYQILENIRSVVGEWNSRMSNNLSNNMIVGYTFQDESRASRGDFFPLVDIQESGSTYTSFGFEPFTPNNQLRYSTFQFQNNLTYYKGNHTLTAGITFEKYASENVFFPGSQSVYVYNSLDDFYTDANGFLADPNRTTSPVELRRFQVDYANLPSLDEPLQRLEVIYTGIYGQDEWQVSDDLVTTIGLRVDVPFFGDTGYRNTDAEALTFRDEDGNDVQYRTDKLPDPRPLWSPRLGFNWNVNGNGSTQIRGGTGIFTAPPPYVWISNQIGNNGLLLGGERLDNSTERPLINRPFNPDTEHYKPEVTTGQPAARYALALTDPEFKFPQIWRSNIAIDQKLPLGFVGTLEFIYGRDVNGIYYINANLPASDGTLDGPDDRSTWSNDRINSNIDNAIVLKNQNIGRSYNISASLERPFTNGFYTKFGYNYGVAKNTVDPGSIANGSWFGNPHAGDPNNPGLSNSTNFSGHRVFAALNYRKEYFDFGATSFSFFFDGFTQGNTSYTVNDDLVGDGGNGNNLLYIPNSASELNFEEFTSRGGTTFSVAQQEVAFDAFIDQDPYLSERRGQYAERNGAFLPMLFRADFNFTQEFFVNVGDKRNTLQLRADILNFTNLLNSNWGVSRRFRENRLLNAEGINDAGEPVYTFREVGDQLVQPDSFQYEAEVSDVWQLQLGIRYIFN